MIKQSVSVAVLAFMSGLVGAAAQNPGGVKSPVVWFKTTVVDSVNGSYRWTDSVGGCKLRATEEPYSEKTAVRSAINTYNFNPAMPFDSTVSQEFLVKGSSLDQKTVIGVVGAKKTDSSKDAYIYHIRSNNGRVLGKTKVLHIGPEGTSSYDYMPNLKLDNDTAKRVKIVSYLEALKPDHSVWGRGRWAEVSFGGPFAKSAGSDTVKVDQHIPSSNFYSPELIVYPRYLLEDERRKVETYLALKYGITISGDYLSPSGMKLWGGNEKMRNRITGFGRDVRSGFEQPVSTTAYEEHAYDVDDTYYLCNSNNKSSAYNLLVMGFMDDSSLPDTCYVMFADNNKETSILTDYETPDSLYSSDSLKLMQRHWMLKTVGLDSTHSYQVELGYNMTKDSLFSLYRNQNTYLVFNNHGKDEFDDLSVLDTVRMTEADEDRQKAIFSDVKLSPLCYFTFGFKGVPLEKPKQQKYDYYLELKDPNCDGAQDLADGQVKLYLPERESGFYYSFGAAGQGGGGYEVAYDSIVKEGLAHGNYKLTLIPQESNSIQFNGSGVTLINVNFINNNGSAEWVVADAKSESRVAFMNQWNNQITESVLLYGVMVSDGKMYRIENGVVSSEPLEGVSVAAGDRIRLDRTTQTNITVYKNAAPVFSMAIPSNSNFKLGVKSENGNVSEMVLGNFEWGVGQYPFFFFDQYQSKLVFAYEDGSVQSAGPTGFMEYDIDMSDYCYNQYSTFGNGGLVVASDPQNNQIIATYSSDKNCEVTYYLYDVKGVLYATAQGTIRKGQLTRRFTVANSGVYVVKVSGCDGETISERVILSK